MNDGQKKDIKEAEERGKQRALLKSIKQFIKYDRFNAKLFEYWRKGGEFVECEVCGGLCLKKTGD